MSQPVTKATRSSRSKPRRWNGRDFYVVLGRKNRLDHRWSIASTYGLLNAGGQPWYWEPLRNLRKGKRVFAFVGGMGYVGIGRVTGEMIPARDANVEIDGRPQSLLNLPEVRERYRTWWEEALSEDAEVSQMVVPVKWLRKRPLHEAFWEKELFASPNTVCKLRDERTIEAVESAFGLVGPARFASPPRRQG